MAFEIKDGVLRTYIPEPGVTEVTVPDGVKAIGYAAFRGRKGIKRVIIPEGVTHIRLSAFADCANLESVMLPESLVKICDWAFEHCESLKSVDIRTPEISWYAFCGCSGLDTVTISPKTRTIGGGAFLHTPWLANTLKACPLVIVNGIVIAANPETCEGDIVIPEGVRRINDRAFYGCKRLTGVTLPKSVTAIGKCAFSLCRNLERISMGKCRIGEGAFYGCKAGTAA